MQVFISYSSANKEIVKKYREEFLANNIDVWMAPYSIPYGENYLSSIPKGIVSSDVIIVFISSTSLTSEWVEKELENSCKINKKIVPIFIENVSLTPALNFLLSKCQSIKYSSDSLNPKVNLKGLIAQIHGFDQKPKSIIDEYNSLFLKKLQNLNLVFSNLKYSFSQRENKAKDTIDLDSLVTLHSKADSDINEDNLINSNNKYFVIGGAGTGKSTLIKKTLYDVCVNTIANRRKLIPLYINLPRLINSKKIDEHLLFDYFINTCGSKISFEEYKQLTKDHHFVIAFDGLDEYSLEDNQIKIDLLNNINQLHKMIDCSIIIGCRNISFLDTNGYSIVKLNPMSKDQAIDFIEKYFNYFSTNVSAKDFFNKLPSNISQSHITPLLLSILIATYIQTNKVPDSLDNLYNLYIRKLLSYVNDDVDFINTNFLAACKVAFEMIIKGCTSISKSVVEQLVGDKVITNLIYSGLLIMNDDDLMFIHSTFMEYLAQLESSKEYGFIPKETMDQHFLKDEHIINKMLSVVNITKDDDLMELGAGIGSVSSHFPPSKTLTLVDLDPGLCKILRYNFKHAKNTTILEMDAIEALKTVKFNKLITDLPYFLTKDILNTLKTMNFDICVMSVKQEEQFTEFNDYFNIVELTVVDGSCFYPHQPFASKLICVTKKRSSK